MPEYMFISGNSVLQKHRMVHQYFLDLHPEVSLSAPEVHCQWIALVSSKLYKVVSYFLQKLDVSTIQNTLKHFEAYSVFEKVFLFRLFHISA